MMNLSKFNTLENKLLKLKNRFVLLDKDVANLYEIEPKKQYDGSNPWFFTEKSLYIVATIKKTNMILGNK